MRISGVLPVAVSAVVLAALSAFVYGYEYGITPNHIQILPFIEKLKDPALFPNDYFVNTIKRFPSAYPYIMAILSRFAELEALHLILYSIFKPLLLIFAYYLSRFLFNSPKAAFVAMFMFAFSPLVNAYGLLGYDPLMKTSFYQTSAVAPLAVLSILAFLKRKYVASAVILSLIYYVNALIGNFLIVIFLAALYKRGFKGALKPAAVFLCLMIPGAVWVLAANAGYSPAPSPDFASFLKLWFAGHYFPSTFSLTKWRYFLVICIFFAVFFRKGFKYCREKESLKYFLFAIFGMWALGAIFGEFLQARSMILLQFLRSDVLFIVFGLVFAAYYIGSLLDTGSVRDAAIAGLITLALIEFSKPFNMEFILVVLLLYEFRLPIEKALKKITYDPERIFGFLCTLFVVFLITLSAISFFIYKSSPKNGCMLLFLTALLAPGRERVGMHSRKIFTIAVFAIAFLSYVHIIEYRVVSRNFSNNFGDINEGWKKLQLWARDNAAPDAVFIAPLDMNGFRVFSNRSVFVDWVDGAAMHWAPGFEGLWAARLSRLGVNEYLAKMRAGSMCGLGDPDSKSIHRFLYMNMTEEDFRSIRRDYGAEYVIEYASRPLSFRQVYSNPVFRVYRIR